MGRVSRSLRDVVSSVVPSGMSSLREEVNTSLPIRIFLQFVIAHDFKNRSQEGWEVRIIAEGSCAYLPCVSDMSVDNIAPVCPRSRIFLKRRGVKD